MKKYSTNLYSCWSDLEQDYKFLNELYECRRSSEKCSSSSCFIGLKKQKAIKELACKIGILICEI